MIKKVLLLLVLLMLINGCRNEGQTWEEHEQKMDFAELRHKLGLSHGHSEGCATGCITYQNLIVDEGINLSNLSFSTIDCIMFCEDEVRKDE